MIKQTYYECHITLDPNDLSKIDRNYTDNIWHSSVIDGDIEIPGKNAYLTRNSKYYEVLESDMYTMCSILESISIQWKRRKIEHIILDEKRL